MREAWFKKIFLIVQIATIAVFLGRAWQHWFWEAPYRTLLWDENWMRPLIEGLFGTSWETYVTTSDATIQKFIKSISGFYLICALAAIFIKRWKKVAVIALTIGGCSLIFLAALYCKEKFFHLGQFLEYTLQWSSPFFLIWLFKSQEISPKMIFAMKVAVALTFICHGLYAIGYYPRPVGFMEMTMNILPLTNAEAVIFLKIAGVLDFIASVLIFLPGRIGIGAIGYCLFWGFSTTIARIWAHFYPDFLQNLFMQWIHESVFRFPHFLIPAAILLWQITLNSKDFRQAQ